MFCEGETKSIFHQFIVFKYAYITIKASDEAVTNNAFANNLMHLKSNYLETKRIDKCKIIITAPASKFLNFAHTKGCGLPENSVEVSGKRKGS